MNAKDQALANYIEFNLIGLVETLKPYISDSGNKKTMQEIYSHVNGVYKEIEQAIEDRDISTEKTK